VVLNHVIEVSDARLEQSSEVEPSAEVSVWVAPEEMAKRSVSRLAWAGNGRRAKGHREVARLVEWEKL